MFANPLRVVALWSIMLSVPTAGFASTYLLLNQRFPKGLRMALPPAPVTGRALAIAPTSSWEVVRVAGITLAAAETPAMAPSAPTAEPTPAMTVTKAMGLTASVMDHRLRVILALDGPASAAYSVAPGGRGVVLAMPEVTWPMAPDGAITGAGPLSSYSFKPDRSGTGGNLTINANEAVDLLAVTPQQPDGAGGWRLVIDLQTGAQTPQRRGGFLTWSRPAAAPKTLAQNPAPATMGEPEKPLMPPGGMAQLAADLAPEGWVAAPATASGLTATAMSERTRLSLALSGPTSYAYSVNPDGSALLLTLPQADWTMAKSGSFPAGGRLSGWALSDGPDGKGGVLTIRTATALDIAAVTPMRPEGTDGWRLVVDLQEQKPLVRRGGMVLWLTKLDDGNKPMADARPVWTPSGPRIELASTASSGSMTLPSLMPVAAPLMTAEPEPILQPSGMLR